MLKFIPCRKTLNEAMKKRSFFNTVEELKTYVISFYGNLFTEDDVVINEREIDDGKDSWYHTHYLCVKRFRHKEYECPQCVGMVDIEE
jgi:hypothetical protein